MDYFLKIAQYPLWRKGSLGRILLPLSYSSLCLLKSYHGGHFCSLPLLSPLFPSAKWQVACVLGLGTRSLAQLFMSTKVSGILLHSSWPCLMLWYGSTSNKGSGPSQAVTTWHLGGSLWACAHGPAMLFSVFQFFNYFWFIIRRWLRPEPVIKSVGEMWVHSQMVNHSPVLGSCAPGNCHDMVFWRADFLYDWQINLVSVHVYAG